MARSLWKGPFIDNFLIRHLKSTNKDSIHFTKQFTKDKNTEKHLRDTTSPTLSGKLWSRRSVILPQFIDSALELYNGKQFIRLKITQDMIGHKFGEFALTRKKPKHPTIKKNIKITKK